MGVVVGERMGSLMVFFIVRDGSSQPCVIYGLARGGIGPDLALLSPLCSLLDGA